MPLVRSGNREWMCRNLAICPWMICFDFVMEIQSTEKMTTGAKGSTVKAPVVPCYPVSTEQNQKAINEKKHKSNQQNANNLSYIIGTNQANRKFYNTQHIFLIIL